jgi:hypothetical protein
MGTVRCSCCQPRHFRGLIQGDDDLGLDEAGDVRFFGREAVLHGQQESSALLRAGRCGTITLVEIQVQFVDAFPPEASDGKLGNFRMGAIPEVGETVTLQEVNYTVQSRRWAPSRFVTFVTISLRKG